MRREAAAERGSSTASPPDVPSPLIAAAADATDRDNLDRNSNARDAAGDVTLVCGNDEVFEARHLLVQHFRAKVGKLSNPKVVKVDFEHFLGHVTSFLRSHERFRQQYFEVGARPTRGCGGKRAGVAMQLHACMCRPFAAPHFSGSLGLGARRALPSGGDGRARHVVASRAGQRIGGSKSGRGHACIGQAGCRRPPGLERFLLCRRHGKGKWMVEG